MQLVRMTSFLSFTPASLFCAQLVHGQHLHFNDLLYHNVVTDTCPRQSPEWEAQQTLLPSYSRQLCSSDMERGCLTLNSLFISHKVQFCTLLYTFKKHSLVFNVFQSIIMDVGTDKSSNKMHKLLLGLTCCGGASLISDCLWSVGSWIIWRR